MDRDVETNWVKDYIELLKKDDDVNFFFLKAQHFPPFFYKYRKLKNALHCLENDYLWMSKAEELNDPFESSLIMDHNEISRAFFTGNLFRNEFKKKFHYNFPEDDIEKIKNSPEPFKTFVTICNNRGIPVTEIPEKFYEETTKNWKEYLTKMDEFIRICSFGTSYESLLMWAHYADNHKGICIEYDFINCSDMRVFMQPVYYSNKRSSVNSIPDMNLYSKIIASISKSEDWKYEKEWRFVSFTPTQLGKMNNHLPVPKPTAIYLGGKFDLNNEDEKKDFARIIETKKIPIYQMTNHPAEYKLIKAI